MKHRSEPAGQPAIILARTADGWTWELINADGASIADGVADDQVRAMQSAWRISTALPSLADDFPDIVLRFP